MDDKVKGRRHPEISDEEDAAITAAAKADYDTAPLTDEEIARLRPTRELFEELGIPMPRRRGAQKAPTKRQVTLRLDADTLDYFRSTGKGWQTRMGDILTRAAKRRQKAG